MVTLNREGCSEARIVLGAVAPTPIRAKKAESLLQGQPWTSELVERAGDVAAKASKPISDVRASGAYRKQMVAVLTRRALEEAHERAISHTR
jgi:carbon-monoxide dehydrogenase medium subunit